MVIDNPHALPLPTGAASILRVMFTGYERVTIGEELAGGFSGSRVFVVHPLRSDGLPELPTVVKLGPHTQIAQEWRAYQAIVQNRLPGVAAIQGPPHGPDGAAWTGLRYPLAGSGTFTVESLQQYYGHASAEELRYVLEQRLFRQLGSLWRFSRSEPDFSFRDSYDYLLPVNLTLRLERPPAGTRVHTLEAAAQERPDLAPGDFVYLRGFVVAEVEPAKGEVTLNLPGPGRSFRVRLAAPVGLDGFAIGLPVEELAGRVVTTRRETLAVSALETWGYGFDAGADTFALSGGRAMPNPLARLPAVLAATPTVRLAAIHGDLNPQNVLVDPETREVRLIDFADARQDHVLHDLLRLETGIVTRLLPQSLQSAGLPPEVLVALYEQLAADPEGAASTAPALAKASAMLAAVRREARSYLFNSGDWTEYWHGLTLYLLGAHKYANLPVIGKKLAFLGAATAQQLVAESAWRTPSVPTIEEPVRARHSLSEDWPEMHSPRAPDVSAPAAPRQSELRWLIPAGAFLVALIALFALLLSGQDSQATRNPDPVATAAVAAQVAAAVAVTPTPTRPPVTPTPRPSATLPATRQPEVITADCDPRGAGQSFVILLDLSQSMHGEKLDAAVAGLQRLIACLDPSAEIAVYHFNDAVNLLPPAGPLNDVGEELQQRLELLFAGGNSALFDAVCSVMETTAEEGEDPATTFILLSDGPDTASTRVTTESELLDCIPPEARLHTIAYGGEADSTLLSRLAVQGQGTALVAAPQTLIAVLLELTQQP